MTSDVKQYPQNSHLLILTIEYLSETRASGIFEAEIYQKIPRKFPVPEITF